MKSAATFLYRPLRVEAIQLPATTEDPTEDWKQSLHQLLDGIEWESGRNGTLAIIFPGEDPIIAEPGDWIVRDYGNMPNYEPVGVLAPEDFERRFMPADRSAEFLRQEAERVGTSFHLTTP